MVQLYIRVEIRDSGRVRSGISNQNLSFLPDPIKIQKIISEVTFGQNNYIEELKQCIGLILSY